MPKSCIAEGFRSLLSNYFIVVASTHNLLPFFNFLRYTSDTYNLAPQRSPCPRQVCCAVQPPTIAASVLNFFSSRSNVYERTDGARALAYIT